MTNDVARGLPPPAGPSRVWSLLQTLLDLKSIPRPPEALDPLIDATERAVSRHGLRRTTMSDLAREMNVARSTLYRQIESVDDAIVLAGARSAYRFLDDVSLALISGAAWSTAFVDAVLQAIALREENLIVKRLFEDEPQLLGEFVSHAGAQATVDRLAELARPMLQAAMNAGQFAPTDPELSAEIVVRTVISLILLPPRGDRRAIVELHFAALLSEPNPTRTKGI